MKERELQRQQMGRVREEKGLIKVPEPVVLKSQCQVKGLKLLEDEKLLVLGMEDGATKVVDKLSFEVKAEQTLIEAPVLKIDQTLQAVLV